jgi:hypothetical protein
MFYEGIMRLDETDVTDAILSAPGWARIGITMPDPAMRQRAACELARAILAGIGLDTTIDDANQFELPICLGDANKP